MANKDDKIILQLLYKAAKKDNKTVLVLFITFSGTMSLFKLKLGVCLIITGLASPGINAAHTTIHLYMKLNAGFYFYLFFCFTSLSTARVILRWLVLQVEEPV